MRKYFQSSTYLLIFASYYVVTLAWFGLLNLHPMFFFNVFEPNKHLIVLIWLKQKPTLINLYLGAIFIKKTLLLNPV